MTIDLIIFAALALAVFKGYRKGLILALFSFAGYFIGLAAALKLSAMLAVSVAPDNKWMPFFSFIIVFLITVWIVMLTGRMLQGVAGKIMMGWLNKLAGAVIYVFLYILIISIVLFFAGQLNLISDTVRQNSMLIAIMEKPGPDAFNALGNLIPLFKDMFDQLLGFFGNIENKLIN